MTDRHSNLRAAFCPGCAAPIGSAIGDGSRRPRSGDVAVCSECAMVLEFTLELSVVPLDIDSLSPDTRAEVDELRAAILAKGSS